MKKWCVWLTVILVIMNFSIAAHAEMLVNVNEKDVDRVVIKQDRIFVPLRSVFEAYGAFVVWDEETGSVVSVFKGESYVFKPYATTVIVNGAEQDMQPPSFIEDGKIFVSIRFVNDMLGAISTVDTIKSVLNIKTGTKAAPTPTVQVNAANSSAQASLPTVTTTNASDLKLGKELIINGGFEAATYREGWLTYSDGFVQQSTSDVHSGKSAAKVVERRLPYNGIQQNLTDVIKQTGPGKYKLEGWFMSSAPKIKVDLLVEVGGNKNYVSSSVDTKAGTWTQLSKVIDLRWTGDLSRILLIVQSNEGITDDFYLDDVSLRKLEN